MLENFLPDRAAVERLRESLLGPHWDAFIATVSPLGDDRADYAHLKLRFFLTGHGPTGSPAFRPDGSAGAGLRYLKQRGVARGTPLPRAICWRFPPGVSAS